MLKLCLANAIFVINYPRKKNCSVLHSTTYLPCHLLPVGVSHLLGLIPGKKNYIQLTCFMPTYYQSSWSILLVITLCQRKKSVADFYGLIDLNTKRNQKFYSKSN